MGRSDRITAGLTGLTDADLLNVDLRVRSLDDIGERSLEKPDPSLAPELLRDYHLNPPAGVSDADYPRIWCCHCQQHTHWHGYLITNETRLRYTIGSSCGPEHYGMTDFQRARNAYTDVVNRQRYLQRVRAIAGTVVALVEECDSVLQSPALRAIDLKRQELKSACPAVMKPLATRLRTFGGNLFIYEDVRDRKAEEERETRYERELAAFRQPPEAEQRALTRTGREPKLNTKPIYKKESVPIGAVGGQAMLSDGFGAREAVFALKQLLVSREAVWNAPTDQVRTPLLRSALKVFNDAVDTALHELAAARDANAFFHSDSLSRLCQWATSVVRPRETLTTRSNALVIESDERDTIIIRPFAETAFPPMPCLAALVAARREQESATKREA